MLITIITNATSKNITELPPVGTVYRNEIVALDGDHLTLKKDGETDADDFEREKVTPNTALEPTPTAP